VQKRVPAAREKPKTRIRVSLDQSSRTVTQGVERTPNRAMLRAVPCDVPLGSHTDHYNMAEKYATLMKNPNGPNPFIDPQGCKIAAGNWEAVFQYYLEKQKQK
jgi:hypothetical protein